VRNIGGVGVYELGQELAYAGQPVSGVSAVLPFVIHTSSRAAHSSRAALKMNGVNSFMLLLLYPSSQRHMPQD
jgi:hypothetical protein